MEISEASGAYIGISEASGAYMENSMASAKKIWHALFSNFSTLRLSHENSRRRL